MKRSLASHLALFLMLMGTGHATACQAQLRSQPTSTIVFHLQILSPANLSGAVWRPIERHAISDAKRPTRPVALKPSRPVRLRVTT